jgi:hypothetical protein
MGIRCADLDVLTGKIVQPGRGVWTADLKLSSDTAPSGQVSIVADGGLTLKGTVVPASSGVAVDVAHVRIVGGAGGLTNDVSGSFESAQASDVLKAITDATGEALSSTISSEVLGVSLDHWHMGVYKASRALDELADFSGVQLGKAITWRVLPDGTIWIGEDTFPALAMPDDAVIEQAFPSEQRTVLGVSVPFLSPGVNLDTVGNINNVEHWITPGSVRTWVIGVDIATQFRSNVRTALNLPAGSPIPAVDKMAFYRAKVDSVASDGSTVDVTPANSKIPPKKNVPLRSPMAGTVVIPKTGGVVLVGWEGADPAKFYAIPAWEPGGGASKVTIGTDALELAGNTYAIPTWDTYATDLETFFDTIGLIPTPVATLPQAAAALNAILAAVQNFKASKAAASDYKSTKVKNG